MLALSLATAGVAAAAKPEFSPVPAKKNFTSTGGRIETEWGRGGEKFDCTKSTATGEVTGATTVGNVVEKWIGCTDKTTGGQECSVNSPTGKSGEVITNTLKGELGTIVPKPTSGSDVALLLEPKTGKVFVESMEGACLEVTPVSGTIAGKLEPLGKQLVHNLAYSAFHEITEMTLDSGTSIKPRLLALLGDKVEMSATDELKFEEAVEIT